MASETLEELAVTAASVVARVVGGSVEVEAGLGSVGLSGAGVAASVRSVLGASVIEEEVAALAERSVDRAEFASKEYRRFKAVEASDAREVAKDTEEDREETTTEADDAVREAKESFDVGPFKERATPDLASIACHMGSSKASKGAGGLRLVSDRGSFRCRTKSSRAGASEGEEEAEVFCKDSAGVSD